MHPKNFIKRFQKWVNLSIHRRLVIWSIGFWVISFTLLSLTVLWVAQTRTIRETARRNTQIAAIISRDIDAQVSEIYDNARTFTAHLVEIGDDLPGQAEAALNLRLASPQQYRAVYYFDDQGNQLFQLSDSPENLITLKSGADVLAQSMAVPDTAVTDTFRQVGNDIYVSDVYFSGTQRNPVILIGLPVVFSPAEKRVIIYEVNLDNIWQSVNQVSFGQTGVAYVVSRNGIIIAHPDSTFIERQIPVPLEPVLAGREGSREYVDGYSGRSVLSAYCPVGEQLGWGIIVQQDVAEAHAPANLTAYLSLGIWFFLSVAGTVGILIMVKRFTAPIVQLTGAAQKIAETGDLSRVNLDQSPDEVGQMSRAFRQMTDRLQEARGELEKRVEVRTADLRNTNNLLEQEIVQRREIEEKLRQSETKYRDLVENANSIILEMDTSGNITYFNPFAQQFFGYTEEEVLGRNVVGTIVPKLDSSGKNLELLINDIIRDPGRYYNSENENIKSNGEIVWVAWTNKGHYDKDGKLNHILCTGIDRTEQRNAASVLSEQARNEATIAERARLARDLHDAVSQTLFSASLIAEVLPRLWEKNREEGLKRLEEVRLLTRGALAEMRTLLFELRPGALADAELKDLLRHLADSVTGRNRVPITLQVEGICELPPDIKIAIYRIAQEAVNNVGKHSGATSATVTLYCQPYRVTLHIADNGRGFDVNNTSSGSFGLDIMRERAASIGATLHIESKVNEGTEVIVVWQNKNEEDNNDTSKPDQGAAR